MFKMAKKKGSGRKQKLIFNDKSDKNNQLDQTTSEYNEPCSHLSKAIRLQSIKNVLPHSKSGHCKDCRGVPKAESTEGQNDLEILKSVCICLKCGFQGCNRQGNKQHAHKHFLQQSSHTICVNSTTWMVWCYACDKELNIDKDNSTLQKAIKYIREKIMKGNKNEASDAVSSVGKVKGLRNLGNTCFFNSVLQNISQTSLLIQKLDHIFTENQCYKVQTKERPPKVEMNLRTLPPPGPLTTSLKCFLDEFRSSSNGVVVPSKLFGEITKKSPQFRGYRQQDSQELLRYLLDGMRVEELKRIESSMKNTVKVMETPPTKDEMRECFRNAKTFVDELFGGTLVSTIFCTQCKTKSQVFDDFLDLSLPVNNYQAVDPAKAAARQQLLKTNATVKSKDAGNSDVDGKQEKPLSKHQKKMLARKDKKAKRRRRTSSSAKSTSETTDYHGEDEILENEATNNSDEEKDGYPERDKDESRSEENVDKEKNPNENQTSEAKSNTDNYEKLAESMANITITDHQDFVLIEKNSSSQSTVTNDESRSEDGNVAMTSSLGGNDKKSRSDDEEIEMASSNESNNAESFSKDENETMISSKGGNDMESQSGNDDIAMVSTQEDNQASESATGKRSPTELENSVMEKSKAPNQQILGGNVDSCLENGKVESVGEITSKDSKRSEENGTENSITDSVDKNLGNSEDGIIRSGEALHIDKNSEEIGVKLEEGISTITHNCVESKCEKADDDDDDDDFEKEQDSETEVENDEDDDRDEVDNDNNSEEAESCKNEEKQEDIDWIETVGTEYKCKTGECSIMSCLNQFSSRDWLTGNNKFRCEECTRRREESTDSKPEDKKSVFTVATKQMLLSKPASILTLHLKRFEHAGRALRKVNKFIEFPVNLDMSPFFHKTESLSKDDLQYSLCGIVEHSGSLHGGHYVAYVKNKSIDNKVRWYHVSDSRVSEVQEEAVLRKQAYLLFYQRNTK